MRNVCKKRGINCNHIERRIIKNDLINNDLIVAMVIIIRFYIMQQMNKKLKKWLILWVIKKDKNFIPASIYGNKYDFEFIVDLIFDGC